MKIIPTIIIDQRRTPCHQSSATSISDDFDYSHEDNTVDRTLELEAQLDYLRRMSRYENLMENYDRFQQIHHQSIEKEGEHGHPSPPPPPPPPPNSSSIPTIHQSHTTVQTLSDTRFHSDLLPGQHFQSAYDLHDEEKSKLVRSPELYNIDNVAKHDQHRSLMPQTNMQYRTLSDSALTNEDCKRHNVPASNETSVEFLTTISIENSLELLPQTERLPTPFADVLEKESSPELSESSHVPTSAFSDAFEPTSSAQRPLIVSSFNPPNSISDNAYQTAASDLVHQILTDVIHEFENELSSSSDQCTSSDQSEDLSENEEEDDNQLLLTTNEGLDKTKNTKRLKILRRAQTDTKHCDIVQSPLALIPPIIRRNSQSDTETYFRAISPAVHEYTRMEHSSSEEEHPSPKRTYLQAREHEKYSGEGEESSGGKERIIQRRKRSNDLSNPCELSVAMKNPPCRFEGYEEFFMPRQESLDSPIIDSNDKSIYKHLQETILRTNFESFQIDLPYPNIQSTYPLPEKSYSSSSTTARKSLSHDDYDAGSETDERDDSTKISMLNKSMEMNIRNLLDELVETVHENLSISSHSDATTVIFNSKKNSFEHDEMSSSHLEMKSISSSSSSQSVINQQEYSHSFRQNKAQTLFSSVSNPEFTDSSTSNLVQSSLL